MKFRLLSILICLVLLAGLLPLSAFADTGPVITMQPQNPHYPEYSVATYTVKATGSNLHAYWYMEYNGTTYEISNTSNGIEPWEAYAGETYGATARGNTFTYTFSGIEAELSGSTIWCVIEDGHYDVVSQKAYITVQGSADPPVIKDYPAQLTVKQGQSTELRCVATAPAGAQLTYTWYETTTGNLPDIKALDASEFSDSLTCNTSKVGTRYYVCLVQGSNGGMCYSSVAQVTVTAGQTQELEITTKSLPEATVGTAYNTQIKCNQDAEFSLAYNPGQPNDFAKTGLTLSKDGKITGTPAAAGTYTFSVSAVGASEEAYMEFTLVVKEASAPDTQPTEATTEVTEAPTGEPAVDTVGATDITTTRSKKTENPDEEPAGLSPLVLAAIAVGAAAVGVGTVLLILRKKK